MKMVATGIRLVGNRLQMRIKRPGRGWDWEATGFDASKVEAAVKLRATTQALVDTGQDAQAFGRVTVNAYATRWLADRRARGLKTVDDDKTRLTLHVLGFELATSRRFGALFMDEVRPSHCRAVIRAAVDKKLAPRTVHNVNSVGSQLFSDAVADEVIATTPWHVPRKELPKKRDADPKWRAMAKFTQAEVQALLWAPADVVPGDRRAFYALCYFGALRFGEASALRWGDRILSEGLAALHIHGQYSTERKVEDETKTESVRMMPEHPTLTGILDDWREHGFKRFFGREPTDSDLIVPSRRGRNRTSNHMLKRFKEDLERLGQRPRRQHDLRRSFIGHAVDAGASRDRLKPGTHGLGTTVLELYDSPAWSSCCEQVTKLRLEPPVRTAALQIVAGGHPPMGTSWGGDRKPRQTVGFGAMEWRGGRDLKTRDASRPIAAGRSNSGQVATYDDSASRPNEAGRGSSVPILPTVSQESSRPSAHDGLERAARRPYEPPRLETFETLDLVVEALRARKARS